MRPTSLMLFTQYLSWEPR